MVSLAARPDRWVLLALSAALVVLAFVVSDGFYTIDEVIYVMGVEAFHATGSFVVDNGHEAMPFDALRLLFLVDGPRGLTPQYPVGTALAGAPLMEVFGQRALVVLNLAAGIGTLMLTHALALRLFGCRRVALLATGMMVFCTFWAEYVVGHWPHSVSVFFVVLAVWLFLDTLDRTAGAWKPAALAGLAVGAGLLFRLEGVIILPGFVAASILWARRPVPVLLGGAAGMAPLVALLAWSNAVKFGSWNPLSYGSSGGATDLANYMALLVAIPCALGILVALRMWGASLASIPRRIAAAGALALGLALWLYSPTPTLERLLTGIHVLLFDFRGIEDPRTALVHQPDGTALFLGMPKKALGQSLPWLGCLALLLVALPTARRRSVGIVLTFCAIWILPFALHSWHGGLSSNMRYFLPIVPLLCALGAFVILQLADRRADGPRLLVLGGLLALPIAALWLTLVPAQTAQLHQLGALTALLAITAATLVAGLADTRGTTAAALVAVGGGLGLATMLAADDFTDTQWRRILMAAVSDAAKTVDSPAVFFGPPEGFSHAVGAPDRYIAAQQLDHVDPRFAPAVCAAGYRLIHWEVFGPVFGSVRPLPGATGLTEVDCSQLHGTPE